MLRQAVSVVCLQAKHTLKLPIVISSLKSTQQRHISASSCAFARLYTKEHEWINVEEGDKGTVGLSDHAQNALGDIVYVELPAEGTEVDKDGQIGAVESVKSASDVYSPVSGTVTDSNQKLDDDPGLINRSPLDEGWIFKLTLSNKSELDGLMSEQDYEKYLETVETDH